VGAINRFLSSDLPDGRPLILSTALRNDVQRMLGHISAGRRISNPIRRMTVLGAVRFDQEATLRLQQAVLDASSENEVRDDLEALVNAMSMAIDAIGVRAQPNPRTNPELFGASPVATPVPSPPPRPIRPSTPLDVRSTETPDAVSDPGLTMTLPVGQPALWQFDPEAEPLLDLGAATAPFLVMDGSRPATDVLREYVLWRHHQAERPDSRTERYDLRLILQMEQFFAARDADAPSFRKVRSAIQDYARTSAAESLDAAGLMSVQGYANRLLVLVEQLEFLTDQIETSDFTSATMTRSAEDLSVLQLMRNIRSDAPGEQHMKWAAATALCTLLGNDISHRGILLLPASTSGLRARRDALRSPSPEVLNDAERWLPWAENILRATRFVEHGIYFPRRVREFKDDELAAFALLGEGLPPKAERQFPLQLREVLLEAGNPRNAIGLIHAMSPRNDLAGPNSILSSTSVRNLVNFLRGAAAEVDVDELEKSLAQPVQLAPLPHLADALAATRLPEAQRLLHAMSRLTTAVSDALDGRPMVRGSYPWTKQEALTVGRKVDNARTIHFLRTSPDQPPVARLDHGRVPARLSFAQMLSLVESDARLRSVIRGIIALSDTETHRIVGPGMRRELEECVVAEDVRYAVRHNRSLVFTPIDRDRIVTTLDEVATRSARGTARRTFSPAELADLQAVSDVFGQLHVRRGVLNFDALMSFNEMLDRATGRLDVVPVQRGLVATNGLATAPDPRGVPLSEVMRALRLQRAGTDQRRVESLAVIQALGRRERQFMPEHEWQIAKSRWDQRAELLPGAFPNFLVTERVVDDMLRLLDESDAFTSGPAKLWIHDVRRFARHLQVANTFAGLRGESHMQDELVDELVKMADRKAVEVGYAIGTPITLAEVLDGDEREQLVTALRGLVSGGHSPYDRVLSTLLHSSNRSGPARPSDYVAEQVIVRPDKLSADIANATASSTDQARHFLEALPHFRVRLEEVDGERSGAGNPALIGTESVPVWLERIRGTERIASTLLPIRAQRRARPDRFAAERARVILSARPAGQHSWPEQVSGNTISLQQIGEVLELERVSPTWSAEWLRRTADVMAPHGKPINGIEGNLAQGWVDAHRRFSRPPFDDTFDLTNACVDDGAIEALVEEIDRRLHDAQPSASSWADGLHHVAANLQNAAMLANIRKQPTPSREGLTFLHDRSRWASATLGNIPHFPMRVYTLFRGHDDQAENTVAVLRGWSNKEDAFPLVPPELLYDIHEEATRERPETEDGVRARLATFPFNTFTRWMKQGRRDFPDMAEWRERVPDFLEVVAEVADEQERLGDPIYVGNERLADWAGRQADKLSNRETVVFA
jgi:hypothetical protein